MIENEEIRYKLSAMISFCIPVPKGGGADCLPPLLLGSSVVVDAGRRVRGWQQGLLGPTGTHTTPG